MIIAIYNVFNEARNIKRSIESVIDYVDEVWVFDGAYEAFPHTEPYSTDGTLEIVKSLSSKVKVFDTQYPYRCQTEKRTAMFKGKEGDYYFQIDGDEIVCNPEEIPKAVEIMRIMDLSVGWCWTLSPLYERPYRTTRIFKHYDGMRYDGMHHELWLGDKIITSDQGYTNRFPHLDTEVRVINLRNARDTQRKRNKVEYKVDNGAFREEKDRSKELRGDLIPHLCRAGQTSDKMEVIKNPDCPEYSLLVSFNRDWHINKWFNFIRRAELPESTEIIFVLDSDDLVFRNRVKNNLLTIKDKFNGVKLYFTGKPKIGEFDRVAKRREHILDNWYVFQTEAQGNIILGAEDDTIPDENDCYMYLIEDLERLNAGFVQGVEIGRWSPIIPNWKITEKDGKIVKIETGKRGKETLEEIDGGGWYCFAMRADLFRQAKIGWSIEPPMGPDVKFVYEISKKAKCYVDWNVRCTHHKGKEPIQFNTAKLCYRWWELIDGKWEHSLDLPI